MTVGSPQPDGQTDEEDQSDDTLEPDNNDKQSSSDLCTCNHVDTDIDDLSNTQHDINLDIIRKHKDYYDSYHLDLYKLVKMNQSGSMDWRDVWNPRASMSLTSAKGLLNAPGENNCFLNSAVQVLWHMDAFRRSFRLLSGHACMGNSCIFCALKVIFTQFQYSDEPALPPDALRRALATTFQDQQRFQLGLMDDAAECFENILNRIHFHIANNESDDMCSAPHCIPHQKFSLTMVEQAVCACHATSEPHAFTQTVHYVSASMLVSQWKSLHQQMSGPVPDHLFGQILKAATSHGDATRACPSNCGLNVKLRRTLTNCPDVVSIGVIWDSDRPSLDHIKDVVRSIGTTIRLVDLFDRVLDPAAAGQQHGELHLVGVVCYYGKHYSTYFFHSKMKKWISFDDANVKDMGTQWSSVVDKCCRGHYQPLLLLYAGEASLPVDTATAPQTTVMLPGYKFSPPSSQGSRSSFETATSNSSTSVSSSSTSSSSGPSTSQQYDRRSRVGGESRAQAHSSHQGVCGGQRLAAPEWGCYNSDGEDETDHGGAGGHARQPSYLVAMEQDADQCTCGLDTHQPPQSNAYVSHSHATQGRIDLLGPLPTPQQLNHGSSAAYQQHGYQQADPQQQQQAYEYSQQHYSGYHQYSGHSTVNSRNYYQVQRGDFSAPPRVNGVGGKHSDTAQNGYRNMGYPYPESNLKRTKSMEDTLAAFNEPVKTRPHSARPMDYPNGRPTVIQNDSSQRSKLKEWLQDDDDNYGTYISKKSVESVMNKLQKNPHKSQALVKDSLKVDIPDNTSIGSESHKDSGYRSGSGAGDRSSASSSTASSGDSPAITSAYHNYFTKSCADRSAAPVVVGSRLEPPSSVGSAGSESSSHSTVGSGHHEKSSGASSGAETTMTMKASHKSVRELAAALDGGTGVGGGAEGAQRRLLLQAEGLMEQAAALEARDHDIHTALARCNQAIGFLQEALALPSLSAESARYIRMKQNAASLKSRGLHKRILIARQDSQSSSDAGIVSYGSQDALSSISGTDKLSSSRDDLRGSYDALNNLRGSHDNLLNHHASDGQGFTGRCPPQQHPPAKSGSSSHKPASQAYTTDSMAPINNSMFRKKFTSDYVSREDYFAHHPPPPNKSVPGLKTSMPKSATDTDLCQYSKKPKVPPKPPARTSSIDSKPTEPDHNIPSDDDRSVVDIYATLPRKGKKKAMSKAANQNAEVYQAYLDKQKNMQETKEPEGLVISHRRQWSKEEIRELLLKDYVHKGNPTDKSKSEPSAVDSVVKTMNAMNVKDTVDGKGDTAVAPHGQPPPYHAAAHHQAPPPPYRRYPQAASADPPQHPYVTTDRSANVSLTEAFPGKPAQLLEGHMKPTHVDHLHRWQQQPPQPHQAGLGMYPQKHDGGSRNFPQEQTSAPINGSLVLPPPSSGLLGVGGDGLCPSTTMEFPPPHACSSQPGPCSTSQCLPLPLGAPAPTGSRHHPGHGGGATSHSDTSSITSSDLSDLASVPRCRYVAPPVVLGGDEDSSVTDSNYSSGPPTDTLSDTSGSSRGHHRRAPPLPRHAAVKPALVKKKRKNHKPRKSVTFSDSVCLIAAAVDEQQDETDYMAYVSNLINHTRKAKEGKKDSMTIKTRSQTPLSFEKDGAKTGYDSDFDENTSDSCTSDEVQGDKVRCNLCRKKLIEVNEIYCIDCTHYMAKFQPSSS